MQHLLVRFTLEYLNLRKFAFLLWGRGGVKMNLSYRHCMGIQPSQCHDDQRWMTLFSQSIAVVRATLEHALTVPYISLIVCGEISHEWSHDSCNRYYVHNTVIPKINISRSCETFIINLKEMWETRGKRHFWKVKQVHTFEGKSLDCIKTLD